MFYVHYWLEIELYVLLLIYIIVKKKSLSNTKFKVIFQEAFLCSY